MYHIPPPPLCSSDLDTPSPSNDSPSMSVVPASQTRWAYGAAPVVAPRAPLKPVNDVPLTRDLLVEVLSDLSERLYRSFGRQVCLIVHGGGVMVLHHALQCHGYTQDIDYIHRSFVREYTALGFRDAEQRLRTCIQMTAYHFKLGEDWMNSHADMTLPWAVNRHGQTYDPIYHDSIDPQNIKDERLFSQRGLALVAVPWYWVVALKVARYSKNDPDDCAAILHFARLQRGISRQWAVADLEWWLFTRCWPMQFDKYPLDRRVQLQSILQDIIHRESRF
ncbi:hypothetical protein V8E52_008069 [Russula decolorans]